jgi:hypothetical protein
MRFILQMIQFCSSTPPLLRMYLLPGSLEFPTYDGLVALALFVVTREVFKDGIRPQSLVQHLHLLSPISA